MEDKVKELNLKGNTTNEIAKTLNISYKQAHYLTTKLGLTSNKEIGIDEDVFMKYYNDGFTDTAIANFVGKTQGAVSGFRRKLGLPVNSTRIHDYDKIKQLCEKGYTYQEMTNELNISEGVLSSIVHRQKFSKVNYNIGQPIDISQKQKEFIFGCVLGDGTLKIVTNGINPVFTVGHGIKQEDYIDYKADILKSLDVKKSFYDAKKTDSRTGKFNSMFILRVGATPSFMEFYNAFYNTGEKRIPIDFLDKYYTPFAMAIHFMDDGYGGKNCSHFCTNSFDKNNIEQFIKFLKRKYDLDCTIIGRNIVRIRARSYQKFKALVYPYIIDSMKYKFKT